MAVTFLLDRYSDKYMYMQILPGFIIFYSLNTNLCLQFYPRQIAMAACLLACLQLNCQPHLQTNAMMKQPHSNNINMTSWFDIIKQPPLLSQVFSSNNGIEIRPDDVDETILAGFLSVPYFYLLLFKYQFIFTMVSYL